MRRRHRLSALLSVLVLTAMAAGCTSSEQSDELPAGWTPPTTLPTSGPLSTRRLAFDSDRTGNFEVFTMGTNGSSAQRITRDPAFDSWGPRVSPDRRTILFTRAPAGVHDRDPAVASLWAVAADGSSLVQLRPAGLDGWGLFGHAEWSPDGKSLVMVGGPKINAQIFLTDSLGQDPQPLTSRGGTNIDPSFSADGTGVFFVGCPESFCTATSYEIYRVPMSGGTPERLTTDKLPDYDPKPSPDGAELAWLTQISGGAIGVWDVRIKGTNGAVRRLVGDNGVTSRPQYSANGQTMYVHRLAPGTTAFDVYSIRPDGSALTNLTPGGTGNSEYPSP